MYLFVLKFYHDQARSGFMSLLKYVDKIKTVGTTPSEYGRVLYIYESHSTQTLRFSDSTIEWNFPDKYPKTLGISVRGFKFNFQNLEDSLKNLLEPSSDLINKETGVEETSSVPMQALFFLKKKQLKMQYKIFKICL